MRTALLVLALATGLAAADYAPPKKWNQATGATVQEGGATWKLEVASGTDALAATRAAMTWSEQKKMWEKASIKPPMIALNTRGADSVTGVLVFVAPKAGTYSLSGKVACKPWTSGGKAIEKLLVVQKPKEGAAKLATELTIAVDPVDLSAQVELAEGDELIFAPGPIAKNSGCNTQLTDLKISGP